ncbi:MAG: hypothetical protein WBP93_20230 [Pyrinomonadaceae bacterium]
MIGKLWTLCVLLCLLGVGHAQTHQQDEWIKYADEGGKFTVLLPAQPEKTSETVKGVEVHGLQVTKAPVVCIIAYSDYPAVNTDMDAALSAERDAFNKPLEASIISEKKLKYRKANGDDVPALDFTAESTKHSSNFKVRILIDGNRVYVVAIGSLKTNDTATEFDRYINSFTLTAK